MSETKSYELYRERGASATPSSSIDEIRLYMGGEDPEVRSLFGFWHEDQIAKYILKGNVLDLGSDWEESLSRLLSRAYEGFGLGRCKDAPIYSVNPDYAHDEMGEDLRAVRESDPDWLKRSLAAWADALPFPDGSFRGVFAFRSVEPYAGIDVNPELALRSYSEIIRILEPGGLAVISPIMPKARRKVKNLLDEYHKMLCALQEQYNFEYRLSPYKIVLPGGVAKFKDTEKGTIYRVAIKRG